jgi:cysteine desulfurase
MGRRSGTENVIGIAGFAAAAVAAQRELDDGVWDRVRALRDGFEARVMSEAETLVIAGLDAPRMPNTSCLITPGWKGETQVMQMDLAGFAISAGSACSSGKVKSSRVLRAMGFDDVAASSAIRVSLGPQTTKEEMTRFADAWLAKRKKHQDRAGARTKPGQAA